ncbi:MAG TPA: cupredoxin family copper-binding protein [Acidimicrobiales bacterium]|nr:cupredoxin family copper-binding protein [Acidimicrobiales bacterium]
MRRRLLLVAWALAVLALPAQAATTQVAIRGFAFDPANTRVTTGDTVRWTNHDSASHTVTGDTDLTFRSGVLTQGQVYERTFQTAGSFPYHCDIHPSMRGTVTVESGGTTTSSTSTTTTTRPATTSTTRRPTTTTAAPGESAVTAPRDRTTTTTVVGKSTTTTTVVGETTTTTTTATEEAVAQGSASASDDDDDDDPSHAAPTALAALLLAGVAGGTAFVLRRGA